MRKKAGPFSTNPWCSRHRTYSEYLKGSCPGCKAPVHFHANQLALAGRGMPIRDRCRRCQCIYGLLRGGKTSLFTITRFEGNKPVMQLQLKG